ncbi:MAG: hypothetical protein MUC87_16425 [Bacteroidia bacterium]|jgi:hypothetical protein|nr:hypothetical protein [Bacteroidia bacterium]
MPETEKGSTLVAGTKASAEGLGKNGVAFAAPGALLFDKSDTGQAQQLPAAQFKIGKNAVKGTTVGQLFVRKAWIVIDVKNEDENNIRYVLAAYDIFEKTLVDGGETKEVAWNDDKFYLGPGQEDPENSEEEEEDELDLVNEEDIEQQVENLPIIPEDTNKEKRELYLKQSGATGLKEEEVQKISSILNPNVDILTGVSKPLIVKGLKTSLTNALNRWLRPLYTESKTLNSSDRSLDMGVIGDLAKVAWQIVQQHYGSLIVMSPPHPDSIASKEDYDPSSKEHLTTQQSIVSGLSKEEETEMTINSVYYGLSQPDVGGIVYEKYNVDTSRKVDREIIHEVVTEFANSNRAKLLLVKAMWPGEEDFAKGKVYIQHKVPKSRLKKEEKIRSYIQGKYWEVIQTLIHEILHAAAHGRLKQSTKLIGANAYNIIVEGICEYYALRAWNKTLETITQNKSLQELITGSYDKDIDPDSIPKISRYESIESVKEIVEVINKGNAKSKVNVGEANLVAAYFMGHVELIGLPDPNKE